ncbi:hypothetical protein D3C81_1887980 [compost metagenome]
MLPIWVTKCVSKVGTAIRALQLLNIPSMRVTLDVSYSGIPTMHRQLSNMLTIWVTLDVFSSGPKGRVEQPVKT